MNRRGFLLFAAFLSTGCRKRDPEQTPEGVVAEWLDRMSRVHGNPEDSARAYALLSVEARKNLEERARRASAATGRSIEPESMLAPSRFSLRFTPRSMRARIAGERAVVEVRGSDSQQEVAQVPCVFESGGWRVDLQLPPLPAIEKRPDAGL